MDEKMQYLKFTYVDAVTGISIASEPAQNGPVFPPVAGLEFTWARESRYPTNVPEFFGTCPDESDTQVEGVLGVYVRQDWETMWDDEMRARNPVPPSCSRRQGELALIEVGKIDQVDEAIASIPDAKDRRRAKAEYDADTWERGNAFLQNLWKSLGGTEETLDELFRLAVTL